MALIIAIQVLALLTLLLIVALSDLERALPFATFACLLIPDQQCKIPLPGLFDITTQRLILVTLLLLFIIRPKPNAESSPVKKVPLALLMGLQVTWALVSTADSIVPAASIRKLLSVVFEYYCLYVIYVKTISSVRTVYRIVYGIVLAIFVSSLFGAVEAYTGWSVLRLFPAMSHRVMEALGVSAQAGRVTSTYPHAILFGAALAVGITLTLHLLRMAKSAQTKAFLWVAISLMFLCIFKTHSRGPWLAAILSLLLYLLFERARVRKSILVIALLGVSVMVIRPGVYETIWNTYEASFDPEWGRQEALSVEYRFQLRRVAQEALARDFRRELWGYGMESFFDLHLEGELGGHKFPFLSCDSAWIEFAVETGYVGLLLIACLLLKPAFLAWKDFKRLPDPDRFLSLTFFISLVIYYFMMLAVPMYAWGQEGSLLWILIALSIVYGRLKESEATAHAGGRLRAEPVCATVDLASGGRALMDAGYG